MRKVNELRERNPWFNELVDKAGINREEMTPLELNELFITYRNNPFCLECLKEYDDIFPTVYDSERGEYACTQCGTVL